jgi:hypothetical protein
MRGYSFALETQGSVAASWFAALDWLILSPKPPSSDMTTDWDALDACLGAAGQGPRTVLKIVVFDDADFAYAKDASRRHPALPVYLQVGNPAPLISADGRYIEDADINDLNARLRWLIGRHALPARRVPNRCRLSRRYDLGYHVYTLREGTIGFFDHMAEQMVNSVYPIWSQVVGHDEFGDMIQPETGEQRASANLG